MDETDITVFDMSPVPMWLHDFRGVREIFQQWKDQGVDRKSVV